VADDSINMFCSSDIFGLFFEVTFLLWQEYHGLDFVSDMTCKLGDKL